MATASASAGSAEHSLRHRLAHKAARRDSCAARLQLGAEGTAKCAGGGRVGGGAGGLCSLCLKHRIRSPNGAEHERECPFRRALSLLSLSNYCTLVSVHYWRCSSFVLYSEMKMCSKNWRLILSAPCCR